MLSSIKERLDRDDEGFTLIELMVVVLIIAILLAIAIPTFLSARNSANARAAQSNLRNALTSEQSQYTSTQAFGDATTMTTAAASLQWVAGGTAATAGNIVSVQPFDSGNAVAIQAQGKDKNCYTIYASDDPSNSFTGYRIDAGTCTAVGATPTMPTYDGTHTATSQLGSGSGTGTGSDPSGYVYSGW
jgi:type IV pilus assembly protein PilA